MISVYNDEYFMKLALAEARKAELAGEIPIGAVLVHQHKILA
jgi:tRNA(adenine34) deaminase